MKFQPDRLEGVNAITRVDAEGVSVNGVRHEASLLVPWRGDVQAWPVARFGALDAGAFETVVALRPEVVIFGSGRRLRFVPPAALRPLIERGIGVETMDTSAACRTFAVLANEGRSVVAALLIEGDEA